VALPEFENTVVMDARRTMARRTVLAAAAFGPVIFWLQRAAAQGTPEPGETPGADATVVPDSADVDLEGTPAPRRGAVTIYPGRSEKLVGPWFATFDHESGIEVAARFAGTGELAATLLEEGDRSPASAFFAQDAGALGLLAAEGLFQPLPQEILDRVPERFRSPEGLWVGVTGRARALAYNITAVDAATLPASVMDLTGPEWNGRIGWAPENASFQSFITAMRVLEGDDATRTWLEAMIANGTVNFGDSNSAIVRAVGAGEVDAGLVNHYYLFAVKKEEGEEFPVANHFFGPEDAGSLINIAGIGVLVAAPQPELALEVIDALLSEDGQTYFLEETNEYPLAEGMPAPAGLNPIAETASPEIDLGSLSDLRGTLEMLTEVGLL
jgi:iron(III) transport system substrate-binding protein